MASRMSASKRHTRRIIATAPLGDALSTLRTAPTLTFQHVLIPTRRVCTCCRARSSSTTKTVTAECEATRYDRSQPAHRQCAVEPHATVADFTRPSTPSTPLTMISHDTLYSLANTLGALSMLTIVAYHFIAVNAKYVTRGAA
ncbi:hypothetical protein BC834DRAFT_74148 [Gloeopeniophorella convolvens]|nr:hypothetical protein BC834DRAFT_74148 [Gloeopeniophorella convolvens]